MSVARRTLIVSVNWLGDCCMALPALQAWRAAHPGEWLAVLTKPGLRTFWAMAPVADDVCLLDPGPSGLWAARRRLRAVRFDEAIVLPNSWRAALAPWLAGIPRRTGVSRGARDRLLTRIVPDAIQRDVARHQMWEYAALLGVREPMIDAAGTVAGRLLVPAPESCRRMAGLLPEGGAWVGMLPGAARGPAKQWPAERFIETGRRLVRDAGVHVAVLGTAGEAGVCGAVATGIGKAAVNLAGRTPLPELAAALGRCSCVVCNDSGGMHLAAVMGTPVVAVYGVTDPAKTGPVGRGHRIVSAPDVARSRDVERDSVRARAALEAVPADAVADAALAVLGVRTEFAYA